MLTRPDAPPQVALVTGGARGLGEEFCRAFIQSGCTDLAIVDLKEDEAVAAGQELIKESCRADSPLHPLLSPRRADKV